MITTYEEIKPLYVIKQYNEAVYYVVRFKRHSDSCFLSSREEREFNEGKLDNAFSRARSMIKQYGLCNPWDYFVTFTLDKEKYNRYDLETFRCDLMQWIRDERKRYKKLYPDHNKKLSVVLVPENHVDGAWHMHGWIYGLPNAEIAKFVSGVHPKKLIEKGYLNWPRYSEKFGFCSLGKIRDQLSTVLYTSKYISKEVEALTERKGKHLYFASRPLKTADDVAYAYVPVHSLDNLLTYHGDFCSTGMVMGVDWTFLQSQDVEVITEDAFSVPDYMLPEAPQRLTIASDFDPSDIDPSYQCSLFA